MKTIISLIAFILMSVATYAQTGIVVVHYGTLNDDSRRQTSDVVDSLVRTRFAECEVRSALSSPFVLKNLAKRGIQKLSVLEAMAQLHRAGCKKVYVQTTTVTDGKVQHMIERDAHLFDAYFDTIKVSKPLLTTYDDCKWALDILSAEAGAEKDEHLVLMGHGSEGTGNAVYSMMNYVAQHSDHKNIHTGTISENPTLYEVMDDLKAAKAKKVVLMPLLMLAGNHAKDDINGFVREDLQEKGYQVRFKHVALGALPAVWERLMESLSLMVKG